MLDPVVDAGVASPDGVGVQDGYHVCREWLSHEVFCTSDCALQPVHRLGVACRTYPHDVECHRSPEGRLDGPGLQVDLCVVQ